MVYGSSFKDRLVLKEGRKVSSCGPASKESFPLVPSNGIRESGISPSPLQSRVQAESALPVPVRSKRASWFVET